MGQEVKNPLRAQSKYSLMGSSAKTGKLFFRGSPEHFLYKNAIWDRTPPHLHINCSLHVWGRAQGSQIFKRNSIISIHSKVMAFLVILLSPRGPRRPHIVPTLSLSSPHHPHRPCHPHVIPIAPRRSPCGLHGLWSLWSPHVVPVVLASSPCCPHRPHVIPTLFPLSPSSSHHPHSPQKVPMWSPWSVVSSCCPRHPRIVPIVPTSSSHHLEGLHTIPKPPDTHPTHPPTPWGVGAPNQ